MSPCLGRPTIRDSTGVTARPVQYGEACLGPGTAGVAFGRGAEDMDDPPETLGKFLNLSLPQFPPHIEQTQ